MLTIGSLFSGYGGLDLAAENVFGARTAWVSDIDKGACKVLAHRFPHAPNLGDITTIDWAAVEPVDIITGGSPCQDLSTAGRRAGMTDGTRSNLWVAMREAIAAVQPTYVIWENVRGALSAKAASEMEHCPGCMGDAGDRGPVLRALGRVLGDLADLGFDAQWHGLLAADVGACHGRWRVFVLATHPDRARLQGQPDQARTSPAQRHGHVVAGAGRPDLTLLPTPSAMNPNESEDLDSWTARRARVARTANNGNGFGMPLGVAVRLIPTPSVADAMGGHERRGGARGDELLLKGLGKDPAHWGQYAPAIARHECAFGRTAPSPTEPGSKGQPRLSARFAEWMMGCSDGWITDTPGVTRNEALKLAGNGVVTRQSEAALRLMLARALAVTA